MNIFRLKNNRRLLLGYDDGKVRIIVLENDAEWVCRKESFRKLEDFLNQQEAHAFKGRLQLYKHGANVSVEVKGELTGTVDAARIKKGLRELREA